MDRGCWIGWCRIERLIILALPLELVFKCFFDFFDAFWYLSLGNSGIKSEKLVILGKLPKMKKWIWRIAKNHFEKKNSHVWVSSLFLLKKTSRDPKINLFSSRCGEAKAWSEASRQKSKFENIWCKASLQAFSFATRRLFRPIEVDDWLVTFPEGVNPIKSIRKIRQFFVKDVKYWLKKQFSKKMGAILFFESSEKLSKLQNQQFLKIVF